MRTLSFFIIAFFILISTVLFSCSSNNKEFLYGEWYIKQLNINGQEFAKIKKPNAIELSLLGRNGVPAPYQNLEKIEFTVESSKIILIGLHHENLLFNWSSNNDSLFLTLDTTGLLKDYDQLPSINERLNHVHRQSNSALLVAMLNKTDFKRIDSSIKLWQGGYKINKFNRGIKLAAKDKVITLINVEQTFKDAGSLADKLLGN